MLAYLVQNIYCISSSDMKKQFSVLQFKTNKFWWMPCISNIFVSLCFVVALILFVFSSITTECVVVGASMVPTYNADKKADNDIVFVNKYDNDYEFGDIVVVNLNNADPIIKRVIAVGGDVVDIVLTESGYKLEINGKIIEEEYLNYKYNVSDVILQNGMREYFILFHGDMKVNFAEYYNEQGKFVVPDGEYFVLGDNRHESKDSMYYGTFTCDEIIGTVEYSLRAGKNKFAFYVDYVVHGKFFDSIANCF